jgi:hypothetical protein
VARPAHRVPSTPHRALPDDGVVVVDGDGLAGPAECREGGRHAADPRTLAPRRFRGVSRATTVGAPAPCRSGAGQPGDGSSVVPRGNLDGPNGGVNRGGEVAVVAEDHRGLVRERLAGEDPGRSTASPPRARGQLVARPSPDRPAGPRIARPRRVRRGRPGSRRRPRARRAGRGCRSLDIGVAGTLRPASTVADGRHRRRCRRREPSTLRLPLPWPALAPSRADAEDEDEDDSWHWCRGHDHRRPVS